MAVRVEIKSYFVTYFDCITTLEALFRWTFVKCGAVRRCVNI